MPHAFSLAWAARSSAAHSPSCTLILGVGGLIATAGMLKRLGRCWKVILRCSQKSRKLRVKGTGDGCVQAAQAVAGRRQWLGAGGAAPWHRMQPAKWRSAVKRCLFLAHKYRWCQPLKQRGIVLNLSGKHKVQRVSQGLRTCPCHPGHSQVVPVLMLLSPFP